MHYLKLWNDRRRTIAEKYKRLLAGKGLEVPFEAPYAKHVYHLYILRTKERESLQARLRSLGIASGIYYPQPLHLLEPYKNLGYHPGEFPETQQAAKETLAIPIYPEMTDDQIKSVALAVVTARASFEVLP